VGTHVRDLVSARAYAGVLPVEDAADATAGPQQVPRVRVAVSDDVVPGGCPAKAPADDGDGFLDEWGVLEVARPSPAVLVRRAPKSFRYGHARRVNGDLSA